VLHIVGPANTVAVPAGDPPYVVAPYLDEMQYAYAAADLALCRSGAMTCAELTAVGLPAVYVPLPLRGGEQRFNAEPIVAAGGGLLLANEELSANRVTDLVLPILTDPARLAAMARAAERSGARDADVVLARHVLAVVSEHRRFGSVR
jgi:UDP-N-acetylglucosamine--N-acetylmuramyl-(pentapeptide) pyrophosphoryl-undecaprenol N-acetylglucosamine transferase